MVLGRWGDDGPVRHNDHWFVVMAFQFLQNLVSCLLESSERSMEDSHEKILSGSFVGVLVRNILGTGDQNDTELLFQLHVFKLNLVESLGNFLLQLSWLGSVFLDDLFSSIE